MQPTDSGKVFPPWCRRWATLYFFDRIRRHDGHLRSFLEVNPEALNEARRADALRQTGRVGPLLGIPVSLKDNIETAGPMHTTAGAEILLDNVAARDAPLVARLREAGAVILGKNNLSEFAGAVSFGKLLGGSSAVGGQTVSPYGNLPTGGSSSGSAVATSAWLTAVSIGSEISGSLVLPASWNSVVGMKPSRDLVDGAGVVPLLANNDSPGPVGRSVSDVAAVLQVIDRAEVDCLAGLKLDALQGVKAGLLVTEIVGGDGNADLLQRIVTTLTAAGATLHPVNLSTRPDFNPRFSQLLAGGVRFDMMAYAGLQAKGLTQLEALLAYNLAAPERRIPFNQLLLDGMSNASAKMTKAEYLALAATLRSEAAQALDQAFQRHGASLLVSLENLHSTVYATAGYPAITVPIGQRQRGSMAALLSLPVDGLPAGVTLIGRLGDDARLLAYAYAFEQASQARSRPAIR